MIDLLEEMLIKHEGLKLKPYTDTVGKMTVGVGRNLDDNGISKDEALFMLRNDIETITGELSNSFPFVDGLCVARQDALINMAFNLGMPRFKKFKRMIAALRDGDFTQAACEMLDSKWAKQVGNRAIELADIIKTGEYK